MKNWLSIIVLSCLFIIGGKQEVLSQKPEIEKLLKKIKSNVTELKKLSDNEQLDSNGLEELKQIQSTLDSIIPRAQPQAEKSSTQLDSSGPNKELENNSLDSMQIGMIAVIGILLIFIIYTLYGIYKNRKIASKQSYRSQSLDAIDNQQTAHIGKQQEFDKLKKEFDKLEKEKDVLEKENSDLKREIESLNQNIERSVSPSVQPQPEVVAPTIYYLSIPNNEQGFQDMNKSTMYEPGSHFYRLFVSASGTEGEYEFMPDTEAYKYAIGKAYSHITPACDMAGGIKDNGKRMETLKKGKVELRNGFWRITQKTNIRIIV